MKKTVESVPVSSTGPEAVEIPVSEPVSAKSKNEEAANQALSEYKKALYTTNFTEPLSYQDSAFLKLPKFP